MTAGGPPWAWHDAVSLAISIDGQDRAAGCAKAGSEIEDEMDEIMALDDCMSMVVEFIP